MPQQDADYKKKANLAIFKQKLNLPLTDSNNPLSTIAGGLGGHAIGTGALRVGDSILRGIIRKILPSPAAIKRVTVAPVARRAPGSGLARIQRDLASLGTPRPAASGARSVVMRDRVKDLARKAELDAIKATKDKKAATDAGLGTDASTMRARVMRLARQAELDKKAAMAAKTSSTSSYTAPAGVGPKARVVGKGGRNQVTPSGQAAYEAATGKSMFGPKGEGMPFRQRAAFIRNTSRK